MKSHTNINTNTDNNHNNDNYNNNNNNNNDNYDNNNNNNNKDNNNNNNKNNSDKNKFKSFDSEFNDVIIIQNTPENETLPTSRYLHNTQHKEKTNRIENMEENHNNNGDKIVNKYENSLHKRKNIDDHRNKNKPRPRPLRLENLLKSFFSEEERDLSCDQCKNPKARAKVSRH